MIIVKCLKCNCDLMLPVAPEVGERVYCAHCNEEFEVVWLYPLTIDDPEWDVYIHNPGNGRDIKS